MIKTRKAILEGLQDDLGITAVPQDVANNRPPYPYVTYKFIVPYIQQEGTGNLSTTLENSTDDRFEYDIVETLDLQPTSTLSINAYAKDHDTAYSTMKRILDWFRHSGYTHLSSNNITVVDVEAVGDRTILITDDYRIRYGFDVILRFADRIELRNETIEDYNIDTEFD